MAPKTVMRGTGKEIAGYVEAHPDECFELFQVAPLPKRKFDQKKWEETLARIEIYGKNFPVLPPEALSTDSLYD